LGFWGGPFHQGTRFGEFCDEFIERAKAFEVTNDFAGSVLDSAVPGAEVWDAEVFRESTKIFGAETEGNAALEFVGIVRWSRGLSVGHEGDASAAG
jgi:hypothetical protein